MENPTVMIDMGIQTRLAESLGEVQNSRMGDIVVHDEKSKEGAVSILKHLITTRKAFEEEKKEATGPLSKLKKTIDGWFKPTVDAYAEAERRIRALVKAYDDAQEAKRLEAIRAASEAAKAGKEEEAREALALMSGMKRTEIKGVSNRAVLEVTITNAALLPREYTMPDMAKIKKAARDSRGTIEIPGVEIKMSTGLTVQTKERKKR